MLITESLALVQGLLFYKRVRVQLLLVEVDSAGLVHLMDSGGLEKWSLCNSLQLNTYSEKRMPRRIS